MSLGSVLVVLMAAVCAGMMIFLYGVLRRLRFCRSPRH
jgi:hypothetical protein